MAFLNCCSICGKKFKRPSGLRLHKVVHTGEKSFECTICHKKMSQNGSLQRHVASKHSPPTESPASNLNFEHSVNPGEIAENVLESLKQLQYQMPQNILDNSETNGYSVTDHHVDETPTYHKCFLKDKLNPRKEVNRILTQRVKHNRDNKYYYVCDYCGKEFSKSYDLIRHRRVHTKELPYPCSHCTKAFKTKTQLEQHLKVHKLNKETGILSHAFSCQICDKKYSSKRQLRIHSRTAHLDSFSKKCTSCSSIFRTQAAYEAHEKHELDVELKSLESIIPDPPRQLLNAKLGYQCLYCAAVFPRKFNCRSHMRTHLKRLLDGKNPSVTLKKTTIAAAKPETIDYVVVDNTTDPNNIQYEVQIILPKSCRYCRKTFQKPSDLERHLRIHTGDKPFTCKICEKSFSLQSSLNRHNQTHHSEHQPSIGCQVCGKQFASKTSLRLHLRLHTGQKPFQCEICSKTFRTSGHKAAHMKANKHENKTFLNGLE